MRGTEGNGDQTSTTRCQLQGVLSKRPFSHASNKWTKRFFIIKDGFLLYYPEGERKEFEKGKLFNIHPKGVIPLAGSQVDVFSEPGHPHCFKVCNEAMNGSILMAAESAYDQDKWVNMLRRSARVNWTNAQLGDAMIEQLENQGLQMAEEKQHYYDKLQNEVTALHDEKQKTEELERVNEELEKERAKMEQFSFELKEEHEKIKMELDDTLDALGSVEEDKQRLNMETSTMQQNLEDLEAEKQKTLSELGRHRSQSVKLSRENQDLSDETSALQKTLKDIEDRTHRMLDDKSQAQQRLQEAEERAKQLEEDKKAITEHADQLQVSIKDLAEQKAVTEAELKEEVMARINAERRLREAESSLARLDRNVNDEGETGRDSEEVKEEMKGDVKTLKSFFENIAFEAKVDSEKSVLMKNTIHARKKMVQRAKTQKFETARKKRSKDLKTMSLTLPLPMCPIPESPSSISEDDSSVFSTPPTSPTMVAPPARHPRHMRHTMIGIPGLEDHFD